jgi:Ran GTPase-activating protein (RanGAP) involved in mRNA processing and transport
MISEIGLEMIIKELTKNTS